MVQLARVSSNGLKNNLERQIKVLLDLYPDYNLMVQLARVSSNGLKNNL